MKQLYKMRLFTGAILSFLLFTVMVAEADDGLTMAVISDVHVMNPALLKQDGKAFADYVAHDRKMLKESSVLMKQATDKIIAEHPQCVLLAGDLTKDGETVSHEYLINNYLSRMKNAGIEVFVVPGNHDVDNPHAVEFLGDSTKRVASPKAAEFARLYEDYGYGQALARDAHSLSYVVRLDDDTWLLCLDACEYEMNDYAKNTCVTAGRLKPETVDFIKKQAADAKAHGVRLLAMMHHGIVQHWTWQEKAMSEYLVDDWRKQADLLAKLGIEVVFTGHFHAQDISRRGKIYDIETGSLVSYPAPYRIVRLANDELTVVTKRLNSEGVNVPSGQTLQDYSSGFARSGIHTIVGDMLPSNIPTDLKRDICDAIGRAYVAHLAGDEAYPAAEKAAVDSIGSRLKKYSWKYAYIFKYIARYLWTDLAPKDNNITIKLSGKHEK